MKKKTGHKLHSDEPIGYLRAIDDFLPPPEKLLPRDHTIKVTVALDEKTV